MATVAAVTALLGGLLAGCSDDGDTPSDTRATTSAAERTDAAESSGSSDATASSVDPASGEQVTLVSGVGFRLTEGADWGVLGSGTRNVTADAAVDGVAELVLLDVGEFPALTDDRDRSAQATLDSLLTRGEDRYPTLRRTEDREVNGVPGFVLRSETDEARFYLFGADRDGISYTFSLEVPVELPLADWVEPILASVTWK